MDPSSNSSSSCVKLFLCSNPEDSVVERRALREGVFPRFRQHCRHALGLDVRVVDPFESSDPSRWPDENTRQQLIAECRESSAGPFLLALIGHQYGTATLPAQVEVSEFHLLLQESQQAGVSTQELEEAYQRDENSIPPSYRLRPPHRHTRCAQNVEETKIRTKAKEEKLQTSVSLCVRNGRMTPERAHRYRRSALDADLRFALDRGHGDDVATRGLVYIHTVVNATGERAKEEKKPPSEAATTPTDLQLLSDLCDRFLPSVIASRKLRVYAAATECDRRHGYTTARRLSYAESLCLQVNADLTTLIDSWDIWGRDEPQLGDALAGEEAEQEQWCETLSRCYHIPRPEEGTVRTYVQQSDKQCPLVVSGGPCTGKTVLLAHCVHQIKSWLPGCNPVVVTHFCNPSLNTSPKHVLSSLCYQIARKCHMCSVPTQDPSVDRATHPVCASKPRLCKCSRLNPAPCPSPEGFNSPDISLSELKDTLSSLLTLLPSPKRPVLLVLVGLDQLERDVGLPVVRSLPSPLPPGVKLIVTASSTRTHVLQAVHAHYPECSGVRLGSTDRRARLQMLAALLAGSGRRVTSGQQALLNRALASCGLTLYARLLHGPTSLWQSDSDVTELSLPDGVHSSISALLDRCEQKHGSCLVTRALSYLALSRTGLTEAELADLLCGDGRQSSSSGTRLPQVDVETLLLDLRKVLIRRTVMGSDVLCWFSRHFKIVVAKKYLTAPQVRKEMHSNMADYFSGRWPRGSQELEDPFVFRGAARVNLRKAAELPHHLRLSDRWAEAERGLLMSPGFHGAMVRAGLLGDLVALLERERGPWAFSAEKRLLAGVLTSSARLLLLSPWQLPAVMEAGLLPYLRVFPALEEYVAEIGRERRRSGTGLGTVLCPAPSSVPFIRRLRLEASVAEAAGTARGTVAVIANDGSVWVWRSPGRGVARLEPSREPRGLTFAGVRSSGEFLLLSTRCNKLFLWDSAGADALSDGRYLFCGQEDGAVSVFDTDSSGLLGAGSNPRRSEVTALVLREDRGEMACVDSMGNVTLWDVAAKTRPVVTKETLIGGESTAVCSVDHSGGNDLLLVCQSHQVTLWETCDWDVVDRFLAPRGETFAHAVLCQDGRLFAASLDACGLVLVWSLSTGGCVLSLETPRRPRGLLTTASHLVCVGQDGCLTAWDSRMIAAAGAAPKMGFGVREVLVDPAGAWFYSTDGSEAVWRWSLHTGLPHHSLLHGAPVEKLRLSPNAARLVSLSAGEIYVWLTETGRNALRVRAAGTADILIAPNSSFGVSVSERELPRVWKMAGGSVVCRVALRLSDAQVSPESTFLIGRHHGDLLAASLWFGSICKRFSCAEPVVAFRALPERPDLVVALGASGAVFTWNVAEETVCRHLKLPSAFRCRPHDFQVSSDGSYALLSAASEAISVLDLRRVRLCSLNAGGRVIRASLDQSGDYVVYVSRATCSDSSCTCFRHARHVLAAARLSDGERLGMVHLPKTPSALVAWEPRRVFVGFEDGSVGVFCVSGAVADREESIRGRGGFNPEPRQCPFDRAPLSRFPLATPNVTWS
ncbi:LOW QUALITY PROTEIN: NACHT and WD repeat domain-containing protein 2 [Betta splendens]|uniref:LOW QUALITY PROTEIN: NACHT and WD repeat domain-containing protein 2 n=1 Tax=Betta splendens TaxID=158456 RepID=A0A9W2Y7Z7_BETSP|nr:LOW QUALITY PROTEIN: NACHT and WD repeat domain-containing protein 2 [Betta splendens]